MSARVYVFNPNGWDTILPTANAPAPGALVVKVQPFGCPRNGTMGHAYVEPVDGGPFALVSLGSLTPAGKVTP
jgi:hypothetical protein